MKLAWSAIVKNEAAVLERCVKSLLPHIDCAIVADTGSSDGTQQLLARLFTEAHKSLQLASVPFENFAQARNEALKVARNSPFDWDYLLLSDADMELVVDNPKWAEKLNGGPAYDVKQVAGENLVYWNRRLLNRSAPGEYLCPTHEYLNVPAAGAVEGIWFKDHADGANRPEKFARDIALLEQALKTEARPGLVERIHFYLGQSYFDSRQWFKAAEHYKKRVELGGFEEERWNAQLHLAHCLDNLGDKAGFVWEMLQAYRMRPSRAEALYDLAKYFRERGENHISLLFSGPGMQIQQPDDLLFVNKFVYEQGLKEEFSICAYYDPSRRQQGAKVCNELALGGSQQAKFNTYWYLMPLHEHVPSFKQSRIGFEPPPGFTPLNPSVVNYRNKPLVLVRTVNYTITPEGGYAIRGADGSDSSITGHNPINTRNFLVDLHDDLSVKGSRELLLPESLPPPVYGWVRGFEDSRLFEWDDGLWTVSTVRELTTEGWCDQVLAPVTGRGYGENWQRLLFKEQRRHEKNWMPWVRDGRLEFVYRLGTLIDPAGEIVACFGSRVDVDHISGGSQVVRISPEVHLALVHETRPVPGATRRYYQHRFVSFRRDGALDAVSPPFVFQDKRIEFACGLAYFPQERQLVASYGIMDGEAWFGAMSVDEVLAFIGGSR
jgi:glycosyltransferase involved in cell wall biosynthesis